MKIISFLLISLLALSTHASIAPAWKVINEEKGITVFSKTLPNSPIVAFKGETVMDAPLSKIFFVLLDNDHRVEWVDRLKSNKILETINPFEYVIYQEFNLPWPISNRDFVYKGKAIRDKDTGKVSLNLHSIDHPSAPKTVGIRAELINSSYILTPLEGGKTLVEVEIQSDPKGLLPVWLANLIQKKWPIKTLNGIKNQLAKDHVKDASLPN